MGFPINQGTVKDGILTCHWHHARFDLMNKNRGDTTLRLKSLSFVKKTRDVKDIVHYFKL
jgi:hypothetical protein